VDTVKSIVDSHDGKIKTLADNAQLSQAAVTSVITMECSDSVDGVAMTNLIDSVPVKGQKRRLNIPRALSCQRS